MHLSHNNKLVLTNQLVATNILTMSEAPNITAIMRTLADPTRRALFERIAAADEVSVAELTRGSGVTQGAVSQHLKSLKQAGLVLERPEGRKVYYRAQPEGLEPLFDWMSHYGVFWRERFADLRTLLKEIDS
jgi:DNA-binding transcriptional ArsR family regulator